MIDTSPAALKKLADDALCNTAFVPKSLLLAIAAEKEAQPYMHEDDLPADISDADYAAWYAKSWVLDGAGVRVGPVFAAEKEAQQPNQTYKAPDYNRMKNLVAHFGNAVVEHVATKDQAPPNYPRADLSLLEQIYAEIDSQHHKEQPLEMVATADAPLSPDERQVVRDAVRDSVEVVHDAVRDSVEVVHDGIAPADVPLPEPVAAVGDVYTLHWYGSGPIAPLVDRNGIKPGCLLVTQKQAEAYAKAAVAAERERIKACLNGIDKSVLDDAGGWWHYSAGAEFGAGVLAAVLAPQKGA